MYYDSGTDEVYAVDAATGRLRWSYTPPVDFFANPKAELIAPVSRGVTYGGGRIYDLTADNQLIALDAGSGRVAWKVRVADAAAGYTSNSPGTYWDGEIVVGGPAGDGGLRGYVAAYSARDGHLLWRTYMIPKPGQGWLRAGGNHGGGDVWMPPTIDPASGTAYVSTGNPTPGFSNAQRQGCNPLADATVALDARTGAIEWSHTHVCSDSWDYDTTQAPMLLDVEAEKGTTAAVGAGSKPGFFSVLDAGSGREIARTPYLVRYSRPHRVPTRRGTVVCPGIYGGIEYGPAAYSPPEGLVYVAANDYCMRYRLAPRHEIETHQAGEEDLGGTAEQVGPATGVVSAIDPASGQVRWRRKLPRPANGGALATAGGLVFVGCDDGRLYVLDASSGAVVRTIDVGLRFGSAPIAYAVNGVQYIAVAAGGSLVGARGDVPTRPAKLFVFKLETASH
jgi:alcohol dehydrogenase (cytochrome c)